MTQHHRQFFWFFCCCFFVFLLSSLVIVQVSCNAITASGVMTIIDYQGIDPKSRNWNPPVWFSPISGDWGELVIPNLAWMSQIKSYLMQQITKLTDFTAFKLAHVKHQPHKMIKHTDSWTYKIPLLTHASMPFAFVVGWLFLRRDQNLCSKLCTEVHAG